VDRPIPALLTEVRFPGRTPSGIAAGDLMVYYAAGTQKLFAIARSTQNGAEALTVHADGLERWPLMLRVQMLLRYRASRSRHIGECWDLGAASSNRNHTSRSARRRIAWPGRPSRSARRSDPSGRAHHPERSARTSAPRHNPSRAGPSRAF
jgi:hypothetical protein